MQQHGSKYFARRPLPNYPTSDPGDWSHKVKGQLFQNMVTLYIKLKIITNAATYSVGAKLRYMGYFASLLHPPGRKSWLLFSVRDMSGGLRNPCFTKFSVVNFL